MSPIWQVMCTSYVVGKCKGLNAFTGSFRRPSQQLRYLELPIPGLGSSWSQQYLVLRADAQLPRLDRPWTKVIPGRPAPSSPPCFLSFFPQFLLFFQQTPPPFPPPLHFLPPCFSLLFIMAATTASLPIDPSKNARYPVIINEQLLREDGPRKRRRVNVQRKQICSLLARRMNHLTHKIQ